MFGPSLCEQYPLRRKEPAMKVYEESAASGTPWRRACAELTGAVYRIACVTERELLGSIWNSTFGKR